MSPLVCTRCGQVGEPTSATPGSFGIELLLWLCFLIPGLIYSLWRINRRRDVCALCASPDLIPADSPRGRQAVNELPPEQRTAILRPLAPSQAAVRFGQALGKRFARILGRR